ncbi:MAG: UxaA family hydrolase [Bacillota bacterium]
MEFLGFARPDGSVGVRNKILIASMDADINRLCLNVASSVINMVPVPGWPDKKRYADYLSTLAANPNVAGLVILDQSSEGFGEAVAKTVQDMGKPSVLINIGDSGGIIEAGARATRAAMLMAREISTQRRQPTPVSRLVVGLIYRDESGTGDLLYHSIAALEKNHGRALIYRDAAEKKTLIGKFPVIKKVDEGGKVGRQQGLYELKASAGSDGILMTMASLGVQLVVDATGGGYTKSHTIMPVINITADKDHFERLRDVIELDLSHLDFSNYKIEDYSLLIVNEIIATASGKMTKAEALKF